MDLKLQKIHQETPTVVSLIFNKPEGFIFKAGQFLRWEFPVENCDARCNKRPFTIASSPSENYLMLTTRHGESRLKQTLVQAEPGLHVRAVGPLGHFTLDGVTTNHIVMLAGGVGITPMRSMIKYALDTNADKSITLFYSNKTPEEIVYRQELESWQKKAKSIKIVITITTPQESRQKWEGLVGRVNEDMIKEQVLDIKNAQYFISGPPLMVEGMQEILKNLGLPLEQIRIEKFAGY